MMRTSTGSSCGAPTLRTRFSWMARRSLTCIGKGRSATSSRKSVPPVARWRLAAVRKRERRAHQRAQLLEPDRLGDIVEGARLERRHGVLGAAVSGDYSHRHVGRVPGDVAHEVEALAVRQAHVGETEVVALLLELFLRLGDGADRS